MHASLRNHASGVYPPQRTEDVDENCADQDRQSHRRSYREILEGDHLAASEREAAHPGPGVHVRRAEGDACAQEQHDRRAATTLRALQHGGVARWFAGIESSIARVICNLRLGRERFHLIGVNAVTQLVEQVQCLLRIFLGDPDIQGDKAAAQTAEQTRVVLGTDEDRDLVRRKR